VKKQGRSYIGSGLVFLPAVYAENQLCIFSDIFSARLAAIEAASSALFLKLSAILSALSLRLSAIRSARSDISLHLFDSLSRTVLLKSFAELLTLLHRFLSLSVPNRYHAAPPAASPAIAQDINRLFLFI